MHLLRLGTALAALLVLIGTAPAAEAPSPAAAMLKLLQSGRVPAERLPTIVKLVTERGNAEDLHYVFTAVALGEQTDPALKGQTLEWLATAARERKVRPAGDLSGLNTLLSSQDARIRSAAIDLAGLWKVEDAEEALVKIARNSKARRSLRQSALQSLTLLDRSRTMEILESLTGADQPFDLRALAVSVMAGLDADKAATTAAQVLQQAQERDDPGPVLEAFLDLQKGSKVLATQLQANPPQKDVAKLMLRQMYALGRTDEELNRTLSELAGMNQAPPPPTPEQVAALVKEVQASGDPARGEEVFRRKDLSCLNCHAVSKAGGDIGPDLSAVGSSSPPDYLVASVLDPDQAIKEAYVTKIVATIDGRILQGIVADRTADALVLKDATGKLINIPIADIDEELEGKSLMPKGLVNFMTHTEFLDLAAFLTQLGRPGPYAIRSTQRMQRYRLLVDVPESLLQQVPTLSNYEDLVLHSEQWEPVYARVNGELPLSELAARTGQNVLYIRGDVRCTKPGEVDIHLNSAEGISLWLDDRELGSTSPVTVPLETGEHALVLRIDTTQRSSDAVVIELKRPAGSQAEFSVIDGR